MPALTHLNRIKVGNKPKLLVGELQIGQQLRAVYGQDSLYDLKFYYDYILNQSV